MTKQELLKLIQEYLQEEIENTSYLIDYEVAINKLVKEIKKEMKELNQIKSE